MLPSLFHESEVAMLPDEFYRKARREAAIHAQLHVEHVDEVGRTPCFVPVRARVARVFRTRVALAEGDVLEFAVPVTRPGDDIPFGGVVWKPYEQLLASPFVEAFLNGEPPHCEVALSQVQLLDSLTKRPRMGGRGPVIPFIRP